LIFETKNPRINIGFLKKRSSPDNDSQAQPYKFNCYFKSFPRYKSN
jgi:hypothetical protein